jgi:hypothetical protein
MALPFMSYYYCSASRSELLLHRKYHNELAFNQLRLITETLKEAVCYVCGSDRTHANAWAKFYVKYLCLLL